MQEHAQENLSGPAGRKLPAALIIAIAVVGLLGLGGLGTAYGILHGNYSGYLDQLKTKVAEAKAKFETGETKADATLVDHYNYYATLSGEIGNLSVILDRLNAEYPLLPGRATENSLGISDLRKRMVDMSKMLVTLKDCNSEDASISEDLTALLESDPSRDIAPDMAALAARSDALDASISGIAFTGDFEARRAEFAVDIKKRGEALHYLQEDTAVQSGLIKLLSDTQAATADTVAALNALTPRNDALEGKYAGIDLKDIAGKTLDFAARITARRQQITAGVTYLPEVDMVRAATAEFLKKLGSPVQGANFKEMLAGYMELANPLKALEDHLKAINDKPEYASLPVKRSIADLGLTPDGQTLLSQEPALLALSDGLTKSAAMEKTIDSLIKNTKMTMPDKVSALEDLLSDNTLIVNSLQTLQNGIPQELSEGYGYFLAGCQERTTFLNEFMAYAQDKVLVDGHNSQYSYYLGQKKKYLEDAAHWDPIDKTTADSFRQRANDQQTLANAEKKGASDCAKQADAHKAAYEASRKKYQGLFAK